METEINSQGQVLEDLVNRYIINYCVLMEIPLEIKRISIIASGSSYNAGRFGKYFFENIAGVESSVEYSSEVVNSSFNSFNKDTLYVLISQSGESSDTVVAAKRIKEAGCKILSITNDSNSTIHKLADYQFDIKSGEEKAIAATKTFSATVLMLWIIAIKIAQNKHIDVSEETKNIYSIKQNMESSVKNLDNLDVAAKFLSKQRGFSICGIGYNQALSQEAALKIKETNYINTSSYPMGEFIHGHFAVLNKENVLLVFITSDASETEKNLLNKILNTYKTKSVVLSDVYEDYDCDILLKFQKGQSKIATILNMIITVQLLALKMAIMSGRNVDKPIGLDKVVKVKGL